jgi:transcriptional regulator with XRE-family HTH domain
MGDVERIRACMRREKLGQSQLAEAAGVSQATVSRALSGAEHVRHSRAHLKLMSYVGKTQPDGGKVRQRSKSNVKRINEAFAKIWDGSAVHAAVVAQIIEDLGALEVKSALKKKGLQKRKTALS